MNRYITKVFFEMNGNVDFDVIPVYDKSKSEILKKLGLNSETFEHFDLWDYTFSSEDFKTHGIQIFTVDEFFGEMDDVNDTY